MKFVAAFLAMVIIIPFSVLAVTLVILDCLAREEADRIRHDLMETVGTLSQAWSDLLLILVGKSGQ